MPSFCGVVHCGSRGNRDKVGFFRLPVVLTPNHKRHLIDLSKERRERWLSVLRREDLTESKLKNLKVCSKHFLKGKPAKLTEHLDPDWVPSLLMGYERPIKSISRFIRHKKRLKAVDKKEEVEVLAQVPATQEHGEVIEDNVVEFATNKLVQTDINMEQLSHLFASLSLKDEYIVQLLKTKISSGSLKDNDTKTKYYTGIPTYAHFKVLQNLITPYLKRPEKYALCSEDQLLLTMMKLRLNLDFRDLPYRFAISPSTASSYFKNVLSIMYARLKSLIYFPDRSQILKTLPNCFKESFNEKCTIIIDCFEVKCETPSNLLAAAQAWSNYKHSETIKFLIGITPQGSICFISEGWGGRISDKCITQNSKFLDILRPGDLILADRGFLIKDFIGLFHAKVKIPAFTRGKTQLHPVDLEETRSIAQVRIHVERVIGMLRQKYRILEGTLPITLLATRGEQALVDHIVVVCCTLINLCPGIVPL